MKDQILKAFGYAGVKLITVLTYLLFLMPYTHAQEAVTTAGGEASGEGGNASFTVGQTVYTTISGQEGSAAAGVQQPYEISVSTAIENTEDILLDFKAYPNPTTDVLKIRTGERSLESLSYQLFDIKGEILKEGKITGPETSINMRPYAPSVYFIKVIDKQKELKTFKIIKH